LHDFCQLQPVAGKFWQISWCVLLLLILLQFLTLQVFLGWSRLNKDLEEDGINLEKVWASSFIIRVFLYE
jgi:hypothetical protein